MTTLGQGALPADTGVLRTAAAHHGAHVGIYAEVVHGGAIALGDTLVLGS
jgi:MOSC domain-containing protein YiiM